MKNSKIAVKAAGIVPKLRLFLKNDKGVTSTGPHRVKLIADKEVEGVDSETGKPTVYMRYLVEENGEHKSYQTKKFNKSGELSYFVQRLAEIPEGSEVIMEGKRKGIKNYVEVIEVNRSHSVEDEIDAEDLGDIEDGFNMEFPEGPVLDIPDDDM